jgi:hypothetical protein
MSNEEVVVYWSPAVIGWEMLYTEPKSIYSNIRSKAKYNSVEKNSNMFACPASNDVLQNVYAIKSNLDDCYELPIQFLEELEQQQTINFPVMLPMNRNKISFISQRKSILEGYWDIEYNLKWVFFADEPLKMKVTSPYFPHSAPTPGAFVSAGQMDIGQWFRNINLNYFVPKTATSMEFKVDDSLLYLEFMTDKKIVFKRFQTTPLLNEMLLECHESPQRYGRNMPLAKRYEMAKKSKLRERVLTEIKKNLIEE